MKIILVVDGEPLLRESMDAILSQCGFRTVWVTTASQALTAITAQPISMVIADLSLAEMADLQLLEAMGKANGGRKLPAVLLSGGGNLPRLQRLAELGVMACFAKSPFALHRLKQFIERQADLAQSESEAEAA